jgi:hypothetical protein
MAGLFGMNNPISYGSTNLWSHQPSNTEVKLNSLASNLRLISKEDQTPALGNNVYARILSAQAALPNLGLNNENNAHTVINVRSSSKTDLKSYLNKMDDAMASQNDSTSQIVPSTGTTKLTSGFNQASLETSVPLFPIKSGVHSNHPLTNSMASNAGLTGETSEQTNDFRNSTYSPFQNSNRKNVIVTQASNKIRDDDSPLMGIIVQKGPPLST